MHSIFGRHYVVLFSKHFMVDCYSISWRDWAMQLYKRFFSSWWYGTCIRSSHLHTRGIEYKAESLIILNDDNNDNNTPDNNNNNNDKNNDDNNDDWIINTWPARGGGSLSFMLRTPCGRLTWYHGWSWISFIVALFSGSRTRILWSKSWHSAEGFTCSGNS